jgi:hypothetical protein
MKTKISTSYQQVFIKSKQIQESTKNSLIERIRLDFRTKAERLKQFKNSRLNILI